MKQENLVALLANYAQAEPDKTAYLFLDQRGDISQTISYGELDTKAGAIAYGIDNSAVIKKKSPISLSSAQKVRIYC